jgi:AAA+ superfamily predicted ATPase
VSDDPVIKALRAALAAGDSVEIRLALGHHLQKVGDSTAALAEFEAALNLDPTHAQALEGAAACARACGDAAKAAAYDLARGQAPAADPPAPTPGSGGQTEQGTGQATRDPDTHDESEGDAPVLRLAAKDGELVDPDLDAVEAGLSFADVGGMDDLKKRLDRSFLAPLRNPEMFKKYGKSIGGGIVLYGPPGCGKTYLARALAGEIGARFINIGLSDVLDMWFGESERKIHELFENARRAAPTIMFFDEVDALGQRRTHLKGAAGRNLVNQLLSELDGFAGKNEGVFFLGATNHPWDLDPALRRPGRFDRLMFVPPPDGPARAQILELKLRDRPVADKLNTGALAKKTSSFSGADLHGLVEAATELAIEASLEEGSEIPINDKFFALALDDTRPSTRPWFETARNYAIYSNEGGVYDDLLAYLKKIGMG